MGVVPAPRRFVQNDQDVLENAVHVAHHVIVGDSNNAEPATSQDFVAYPVFVFVVRVAVHLHDKRPLRAEKIGDEPADHGLPAELVTVEL